MQPAHGCTVSILTRLAVLKTGYDALAAGHDDAEAYVGLWLSGIPLMLFYMKKATMAVLPDTEVSSIECFVTPDTCWLLG
eukprot:XP_001703889.1 Hypothetical protein GL50803_116736 [Giardia lamblia ATCC 50803]